jgi:hypothetical protein
MAGVAGVVKDGWGGWLTEGSSRGARLACEAVVSRADRVESGFDICALWRDLAEHVPLVLDIETWHSHTQERRQTTGLTHECPWSPRPRKRGNAPRGYRPRLTRPPNRPTLDQANETAFEWRRVVQRRVHTLHPLSRVLNLFPLIPTDLTEDWL